MCGLWKLLCSCFSHAEEGISRARWERYLKFNEDWFEKNVYSYQRLVDEMKDNEVRETRFSRHAAPINIQCHGAIVREPESTWVPRETFRGRKRSMSMGNLSCMEARQNRLARVTTMDRSLMEVDHGYRRYKVPKFLGGQEVASTDSKGYEVPRVRNNFGTFGYSEENKRDSEKSGDDKKRIENPGEKEAAEVSNIWRKLRSEVDEDEQGRRTIIVHPRKGPLVRGDFLKHELNGGPVQVNNPGLYMDMKGMTEDEVTYENTKKPTRLFLLPMDRIAGSTDPLLGEIDDDGYEVVKEPSGKKN